eukprot:2541554-Amphidinium_carterae.1
MHRLSSEFCSWITTLLGNQALDQGWQPSVQQCTAQEEFSPPPCIVCVYVSLLLTKWHKPTKWEAPRITFLRAAFTLLSRLTVQRHLRLRPEQQEERPTPLVPHLNPCLNRVGQVDFCNTPSVWLCPNLGGVFAKLSLLLQLLESLNSPAP